MKRFRADVSYEIIRRFEFEAPNEDEALDVVNILVDNPFDMNEATIVDFEVFDMEEIDNE